MNTVVRTALAVLSIAAPAFATPRPPAEAPAVITPATVAGADREVVDATQVPGRTAPELEQRVRTLEAELGKVRAEQFDRLLVVGDPDSHPLWP